MGNDPGLLIDDWWSGLGPLPIPSFEGSDSAAQMSVRRSLIGAFMGPLVAAKSTRRASLILSARSRLPPLFPSFGGRLPLRSTIATGGWVLIYWLCLGTWAMRNECGPKEQQGCDPFVELSLEMSAGPLILCDIKSNSFQSDTVVMGIVVLFVRTPCVVVSNH